MTSVNAVIGFPRWTTEFSLAGGSFLAAYPVGNLKTQPLTRVARTVDAQLASTQWIANEVRVSFRLVMKAAP